MGATVMPGIVHVSKAQVFTGESAQVREDRRKAREDALRAASDEALVAAGFVGKSRTEQCAAPLMGELGGVADRLAVARDRLAAVGDDLARAGAAQQEVADLERWRSSCLDALARLGWRHKGGKDELGAACRAGWAVWSVKKGSE